MTKIATATFDISANNGAPVVTRSVVFASGETISLKMFLPADPNSTLIDIHRASVERAIELLQGWIAPSAKE